jgi:hypothetical protein
MYFVIYFEQRAGGLPLSKELNNFLREKLPTWNNLSKPSDEIKMILRLVEDQRKGIELSKDEKDLLKSLVELERTKERLKKIESKAYQKKDKLKEQERRKRNHELFLNAGLLIVAGLVDSKTGLANYDKEVLVGAYYTIKKTIEKGNEETIEQWKRIGKELLAGKESEIKSVVEESEKSWKKREKRGLV